jgi:hypothetical protein
VDAPNSPGVPNPGSEIIAASGRLMTRGACGFESRMANRRGAQGNDDVRRFIAPTSRSEMRCTFRCASSSNSAVSPSSYAAVERDRLVKLGVRFPTQRVRGVRAMSPTLAT